MENKVVKAKDLAVDDVAIIYGCKSTAKQSNEYKRNNGLAKKNKKRSDLWKTRL